MDIPDDMNNYINESGGNAMDIMDFMQQSHQEMKSPLNDEEPANGLPTLQSQNTTHMTSQNENAFTGKPINYKSESPAETPGNDITINLAPPPTYSNVETINLGPSSKDASRASTAEPLEEFMDDDFDDFDAKNDLTAAQQKLTRNIVLARHIDNELNRVADEVINIDEIEQEYRMTKDPSNPKNIFVLKFGANEEQHWRLQWNPTTNLMCHIQPNKLLIEQSKYNALYIKTSITPFEYKKQAIIAKRKAIEAKKELNKKYKVNIGTVIEPEIETTETNEINGKKRKPKPQTTKFSETNINLTAPNNTNLLAPAPIQTTNGTENDIKRGTFMVNNSMLIHSKETVAKASPTDQEQLIAETQNKLDNNGSLLVTPVTSQIRPELIAASQPNKSKPKHARRVSLDADGLTNDDDDDFYNSDSRSDSNSDSGSSDDDDNYYNNHSNTNNNSKLNNIQLSVSISKQEDQEVQRLDDFPSTNTMESDFGRNEYEQQQQLQQQQKLEEKNNNNLSQPNKGKLGHMNMSMDMSASEEWSPPKMTLEKWNAVDVWQSILFLGDEWDALNYLEIMDNNIEYFINCASDYCAFEYENKLKYFWLENWRQKREKEREKQKLKNSIEREKRRKIRLKKFQRANPNWIPKNNNINQLPMFNSVHSSNDEMVQFAMKIQPTDSPIPTDIKNNKNKNKIRFRIPKNNENVRNEFELFSSDRQKEFAIIESLHNEILDLEIDDSDHSSMYDSCISSDEYQYDSDEFDEYLCMNDEEIIEKLCPFKFLNIYAHNWEGYRLLDLHMNDVWNFIEECRMKNMDLKKQYQLQKEDSLNNENDMNENNHNMNQNNMPKISCLIFCTKNNIPMQRLNSEMDGTLSNIGQSICTIIETYKSQQIIKENKIWNKQIENYQKYLDLMYEKESAENNLTYKQKLKIKQELVSEIKKKNDKLTLNQRYGYKYWNLPNKNFWNDFALLKTRDDPLNRLFGSSSDRSSTLVLGFMIHSGIRLKQSYKALLLNKANTLRNQSFLRQLIQLDWMKHCFAKPGMKEQVKFRDEYECYQLDQYLIKKKHYNLK